MSEEHTPEHYVKIWAILMVLLFVSVVGPMFEIQWLTLVTAFGIACVKAFLVATRFMHINDSPRFVTFIVSSCLVLMLLFFAATAVDVMRPTGDNWKKPAWIEGDATAGPAGHGEGHVTAGHH
jgi:caa(3)-type oxidase subunit IV